MASEPVTRAALRPLRALRYDPSPRPPRRRRRPAVRRDPAGRPRPLRRGQRVLGGAPGAAGLAQPRRPAVVRVAPGGHPRPGRAAGRVVARAGLRRPRRRRGQPVGLPLGRPPVATTPRGGCARTSRPTRRPGPGRLELMRADGDEPLARVRALRRPLERARATRCARMRPATPAMQVTRRRRHDPPLLAGDGRRRDRRRPGGDGRPRASSSPTATTATRRRSPTATSAASATANPAGDQPYDFMLMHLVNLRGRGARDLPHPPRRHGPPRGHRRGAARLRRARGRRARRPRSRHALRLVPADTVAFAVWRGAGRPALLCTLRDRAAVEHGDDGHAARRCARSTPRCSRPSCSHRCWGCSTRPSSRPPTSIRYVRELGAATALGRPGRGVGRVPAARADRRPGARRRRGRAPSCRRSRRTSSPSCYCGFLFNPLDA